MFFFFTGLADYQDILRICVINPTHQPSNYCMYYLIVDLPHVRTLAFANSNNRANKEIQTHGRVSVQWGGDPANTNPHQENLNDHWLKKGLVRYIGLNVSCIENLK